MRIALAQINPTLGDFQGNMDKIVQYIERAHQRKCDLIVFPESSLFGYHPFDLLERKEVVETQEKFLKKIQKQIPPSMGVILGLIRKNPVKKGRPYFNSAVFLQHGKKEKFFNKELLPTGDVFDEARFIENGNLRENFFSFKGKKFFLTICEDIWAWPDLKGNSSYKTNPITKVPKKKVDLVINLSASPFHLGKMKKRLHVTRQTAAYFKAPMMYVNLIGAQDEIIFDGASFVIDPKGKVLLKSQIFEEDLNVYDLKTQEAWSTAKEMSSTELLHRALILGIRDFVHKTGFKKVHLGLSGGIDSAVVAALAVDALGPQNVVGLTMPGPYSSPESLSLAEELAKNLSITTIQLPITPSYLQAVQGLKPMGLGETLTLVHENIQSRLRGLFLMAYANKESSLLLTTGNKCEYATGYSTLYGDMCGGLAPIGDLLKKQVYELARFYNSEGENIPQGIIDRAPTAELRPNQKDQDSLPAYDELDQSVVRIVEKCERPKTQTDHWLMKQVLKTEFKRWQAAPILKISDHSFGRGRRYPVAHKSY